MKKIFHSMTKLNTSLEWIIEPFPLDTKIFLLEGSMRSENQPLENFI